MTLPRIMIAGVHSGAGKTTLTLGLLAALQKRGYRVQPFKVGPDYIDPGLHYHAAGRKSHNLDAWMGSETTVKTVFAKNAKDCDLALVEGVMGLFDGAKDAHSTGSSAHIALMLDMPVILVVNAHGLGQSCLALLKGYRDYLPGLNLVGVILNQATGSFYQNYLKERIEQELGIRVLGCLATNSELTMPERHLGLLPAEENPLLAQTISQMASQLEAQLDVAGVWELATQAPPFTFAWEKEKPLAAVRIGVAKDIAFSFYYQDSFDYLEELGAVLCPFSPLEDEALPQVDGVYLGGGFPELFLPQLSANQPLMASLRQAHEEGMPIYAECGGLLYLCRQVKDLSEQVWPGVGLVPHDAEMTKRLVSLGYVKATACEDNLLCASGEVVRGHEFHYSRLATPIQEQPSRTAFELEGGRGDPHRGEGYARGNLLASFVHLHLRSNPKAARRYITACQAYRQGRER